MVPRVHDRILLALGVLATPSLPARRQWLRAAAARFAEPSIQSRFVLGCPLTEALRREAATHPDLLFVGARDGSQKSCIEKSFAWWSVAPTIFYRTAYIGKTDDDSMNHLSNLAELLKSSLLSARRHVYGGWAQFSSFLPEHNVPCGWSFGQGGALRAHNVSRLGGTETNCRFCVNHPFCYDHRGISSGELLNTTIVGPYIFAVGALELMSAALAQLVFSSNSTRSLLEAQSVISDKDMRSRRQPHGKLWAHWGCAAEDNFVGLAVYRSTQAERISADFLSLAGLVVDVSERTRNVSQLVTAHKLEIDVDGKLSDDAKREEHDNAKQWQRAGHGAGPRLLRNATYRAARLTVMRSVIPQLEALGPASRAAQRELRCFSRADVDAGRAHDAVHPCFDHPRKVRWCRSKATASECSQSAEMRSQCNRSCGSCTVRAVHPSIASFLTRFGGYAERWRFCQAETV